MTVHAFDGMGDEPELDPHLRDVLVPRLLQLPGIRCAFAARRRTDAGAERIVATIWAMQPTEDAQQQEATLVDQSLGERAAAVRRETVPLAIVIDPRRGVAPSILRLFRGDCREGELESYFEEVRGGAYADATSNDGMVGLYLGAVDGARFLTLSVWSGWDALAAATGGDIHQPFVTRNPTRIVSSEVAHYEVIASGASTGS